MYVALFSEPTDLQIQPKVVVVDPDPTPIIKREGDTHFINFTKALSLAIPYASNAGGITTMTGTTGSLIIKSYVDE